MGLVANAQMMVLGGGGGGDVLGNERAKSRTLQLAQQRGRPLMNGGANDCQIHGFNRVMNTLRKGAFLFVAYD